MKGLDLVEYMLQYRSKHIRHVESSNHLVIDVSKSQLSVIMLSADDLTKGRIMKDTVGLNASLIFSKRKLDNLGYIKARCRVQNGEERMKQLKTQLKLVESISEMNALQDKHKDNKQSELKKQLMGIVKNSYDKFRIHAFMVSKMQKKEIYAIFYAGYNTLVDPSKFKNNILEEMLKKETTDHGCEKLEFFCNCVTESQGVELDIDDPNTLNKEMINMDAVPIFPGAVTVDVSNELNKILEIDNVDGFTIMGLMIQRKMILPKM